MDNSTTAFGTQRVLPRNGPLSLLTLWQKYASHMPPPHEMRQVKELMAAELKNLGNNGNTRLPLLDGSFKVLYENCNALIERYTSAVLADCTTFTIKASKSQHRLTVQGIPGSFHPGILPGW